MARCTVARLMGQMGLQGAVRGREVRTTVSNPAAPCPLDRVNRQFHAPRPNALWLSDFTYVATWQGFVYVAFVIDAYRPADRRLAGEPHGPAALRAGRPGAGPGRPPSRAGRRPGPPQRPGRPIRLIRYTERLAEAGIEPSVGSVGDSYDNALAESINGLYKTEVIRRRGPWRSFEAVEFATLEWVEWFNNRRLLEPIGNVPPAEAEACYYDGLRHSQWRRDLGKPASDKPGAVQGELFGSTIGLMRQRALLHSLLDAKDWPTHSR